MSIGAASRRVEWGSFILSAAPLEYITYCMNILFRLRESNRAVLFVLLVLRVETGLSEKPKYYYYFGVSYMIHYI